MHNIYCIPRFVYRILPGRFGDLTNSKDELKEIRTLKELNEKAAASVTEKLFPTQGDLERQRMILKNTNDFLDELERTKSFSPDKLKTFARTVEPLIWANAEEAARLHLDGLDDQVARWRKEMTEKEWEKLKVVVMGSALPRKDFLATQFFAKVLGEKGEGKRIIFAEALYDEAPALKLLAAHQVDTEMASTFFGQADKLHRDLLADAASTYLKSKQLKSLKVGAR